MKRFFLLLAIACAALHASAFDKQLNIKASGGFSGFQGRDANTKIRFAVKGGVGYEMRLFRVVGIEPGLMIGAKGGEDAALVYTEIPVLAHLHLMGWGIYGGPYAAYAIYGSKDFFDKPDTRRFDFGAELGVRYTLLKCSVGIDVTWGGVNLIADQDANNYAVSLMLGFSL